MNYMKHKITLLFLFSFLLLSACGQGEEKAPPYYGVFLRKNDDLVELIQAEVIGTPSEEQFRNVPASLDSQPVITFWNPDLVLQYLQFFSITHGGQVRYDVTPKEDGVIDIRPSDPLEPGVYCFIQGNPLASFLNAWCFQYGEQSGGLMDSAGQSSEAGSPAIELTPDEAPQNLPNLSELIVAATQAGNAATAAAVELQITQVVKATQSAGTQIAKSTEFIQADCTDRVRPKIESGDYSELIPGVNLSRCDLSGLSLFGLDLSNAILTNTNLSESDLHNTDFSGADLSYADFRNSDLTGTVFNNTILYGSFIQMGSENQIQGKINWDEVVRIIPKESPMYLWPAWNPESNKVAIWANDSFLIDIENGNIDQLDFYLSEGFSWSPDGKSFASAYHDEIEILDINSGTALGSYSEEDVYEEYITQVLFNPQGNLLLTNGKPRYETEYIIKIWDVDSSQLLNTYLGIYADWAPDGEQIAILKASGDIEIIDVGTGEVQQRIQAELGHGHLKWSPDGRLIIAQSGGEATVWDLDSESALFTVPSIFNRNELSWSPDGKRVITNGTIYDSTTGEVLASRVGIDPTWSPDGKYIFTTTNEFMIWPVDVLIP